MKNSLRYITVTVYIRHLSGPWWPQGYVISSLTGILRLQLITLDSPTGISIKFPRCVSSHFTSQDSRVFLSHEISLVYANHVLRAPNLILLNLRCLRTAGYAVKEQDCAIWFIYAQGWIITVCCQWAEKTETSTTGRLGEIDQDGDFLEKSEHQPILPTANTVRWKDMMKQTL